MCVLLITAMQTSLEQEYSNLQALRINSAELFGIALYSVAILTIIATIFYCFIPDSTFVNACVLGGVILAGLITITALIFVTVVDHQKSNAQKELQAETATSLTKSYSSSNFDV